MEKKLNLLQRLLKTKRCHNCETTWPYLMYTPASEGWFSRDGFRYTCKRCAIKSNLRYKKGKKNAWGGANLEMIRISWWERIKELFR